MASSLNGLQVKALRLEGFTGDLNQMMMAWLRDEGAAGRSLSDLWMSFLKLQGVAGKYRNDLEYNWLGLEGFTQDSIDDRRYDYWLTRSIT